MKDADAVQSHLGSGERPLEVAFSCRLNLEASTAGQAAPPSSICGGGVGVPFSQTCTHFYDNHPPSLPHPPLLTWATYIYPPGNWPRIHVHGPKNNAQGPGRSHP